VLRTAEITLIEALTCQQVITEAERILSTDLPLALSAFRLPVDRCLRVVPDPTAEHLPPRACNANLRDLPILASAILGECPFLVTFKVRDHEHRHPDVTALNPDEYVLRVRDLLANLDINPDNLG
jgi:hypothetical protein